MSPSEVYQKTKAWKYLGKNFSDCSEMLPWNISIENKICSENMQLYWNHTSILSFSCNLMHIFRWPIYSTTSGGPFMFILLYVGEGCYRQFAIQKRECQTTLFKRCYSQACAVAALTDIQSTMAKVASVPALNQIHHFSITWAMSATFW